MKRPKTYKKWVIRKEITTDKKGNVVAITYNYHLVSVPYNIR